MVKSLLYLQQPVGQCQKFFDLLVEMELDMAEDKGVETVFRGETPVAKAFKYYSRLTGIEYLWNTLAPVIFQIMRKHRDKADIEAYK